MTEPVPVAPWRYIVTNAISASRLIAAAFSLRAVLAEDWPLAAGLFAWAVASDFLDGIAARRLGATSRLGGILDHAADALFVSLTLWASAFVNTKVIPGILPFLIGLAFLQYVLDSKVLAGQALRSSMLGRGNGIAYFVLAGIVVIRNALGIAWLPDVVIWWLGMILVVTTFLSMFDRVRALTKTLDESRS